MSKLVPRLRPLTLDDLDTLLAWRNDPVIIRNTMGFRGQVTRESEQAWLENIIAGRDASLVVLGIDTDEGLAGYARLEQIDPVNETAAYGILLGPQFQRHGLAVPATQLMLDHAFGPLGLHRVSIAIRAENRAAIVLIEAGGFTIEGRARQAVLWEGERSDVVYGAVLAPDHAQARSAR